MDSLKVVLASIPHKNQRYETVGDWWENSSYPFRQSWDIRVSEMEDWRYELLVAVHELVEMALCKHRGIKEKDVSDFDMEFEQNRDLGDESEPGDDPAAPYRREHRFAENIERQLAHELNVDWETYNQAVLDVE